MQPYFIAFLLFASNLFSGYQGFIDGCRSYPYAFMAAVRAAIELAYLDDGYFFGFIGNVFQLLLMPLLISMVVMGVTRKHHDLDSHHIEHVGSLMRSTAKHSNSDSIFECNWRGTEISWLPS